MANAYNSRIFELILTLVSPPNLCFGGSLPPLPLRDGRLCREVTAPSCVTSASSLPEYPLLHYYIAEVSNPLFAVQNVLAAFGGFLVVPSPACLSVLLCFCLSLCVSLYRCARCVGRGWPTVVFLCLFRLNNGRRLCINPVLSSTLNDTALSPIVCIFYLVWICVLCFFLCFYVTLHCVCVCHINKNYWLTYLLTYIVWYSEFHSSTNNDRFSFSVLNSRLMMFVFVRNGEYETHCSHDLHCVSKMHQLWNGIAQNYKDRFWRHLAIIFKRLYNRVCIFQFSCRFALLSAFRLSNRTSKITRTLTL